MENSHDIFPFLGIGRWWDRQEEIDIVATNEEENKIMFTEVKYSNKQVGTDKQILKIIENPWKIFKSRSSKGVKGGSRRYKTTDKIS